VYQEIYTHVRQGGFPCAGRKDKGAEANTKECQKHRGGKRLRPSGASPHKVHREPKGAKSKQKGGE